jgi:hypothetical protein
MSKEQFASYLEHHSREGLQRVQETRNPLYLWETIEEFADHSRLWDEAGARGWKDPHAVTSLPNWVVWHLAAVAQAFAAMGRGHALDSEENPQDIPAAGEETITPAAALAEALRVLHLVRPGWNAFGAMRRDRLRENAACAEYLGDEREGLRQYLGIQTDRALSRELSHGRRAAARHLPDEYAVALGIKIDRSLQHESARQRRKPLSRNGSRTDSCE